MPKRKREEIERTSEEIKAHYEEIKAHYEEVITKRSLKFIPKESLREKFKETVNRQKEIDRLWSLKKRSVAIDQGNITNLIQEVTEKLDEIMDVENDPPRKFYKKMLTEQKTVLEGLQGTDNTHNVNSNSINMLHTLSFVSPVLNGSASMDIDN